MSGVSVLSTLAWALAWALVWALALALPLQALGRRLLGHTKPLWHSFLLPLCLLLLCLLLLQLPTNPSPAAVLGGLFGELSITSLTLLAVLFIQRAWTLEIFTPGESARTAGCIALAGWLFYPLVLGLDLGFGLDSFDPYAWGYTGPWLPLALTALALSAWLYRLRLLALVAFLPLLAWQLGLLGSSNLWDYLFDPFVVLGCTFWLLGPVHRWLHSTILR